MINSKPKFLLALPLRASGRARARATLAAVRVASWSGAELVVAADSLAAFPPPARVGARLAGTRKRITWMAFNTRAEEEFRSRLMELLEELPAELLILADRTRWIASPAPDRAWESQVLTNAQVPVLLLPERAARRHPALQSVLVPFTGEGGRSQSLEWALKLGTTLGLPVDLVHISPEKGEPEAAYVRSRLGPVGDQPHHEYSSGLEHLVAQASPYCTTRERQVIRHFLRPGQGKRPWSQQAPDDALIVLEWKGSLDPGRARLVKSVLRHARGPIVLLRSGATSHARLGIDWDGNLSDDPVARIA